MKTFEEIHSELIQRAEKAGACNGELTKLRQATTIEQIVEIGKDNVNFLSRKMGLNAQNITDIIDKSLLGELLTGVDNLGFWNTGDRNTGDLNTGHRNTGDRNTGHRNTGHRNTGDWNTGDRNTGDRNTGDWNTGHLNTGDRNTGDRNTGDWNTGHLNTGDRNTGDLNTGDWNTGDWNTGDLNTGHWNTGEWNTGHRNTGDLNTGHRNTGDRNTGDWNTGDWNTGFFNRDTPTLRFFEKESNWTYSDWLNSAAYSASCKFLLTEWIPENQMTDKEKIEQPLFHTQEGYLKKYEYKQACEIWWSKLSQSEKDSFKHLPNFSAEIFKDITGIEI